MRCNSIVSTLLTVSFVLLVAALCGMPTVSAATVTWTGATDASWGTGGNWSGGTPAGNDVHFYSSPGGYLSNTLSEDTSINSLTMDAAATSPVTIGSNKLTVGAITSSAGAGLLTINSNVGLLGSAQSWTPGSGGLTVNGIISATNSGWNLSQTGTGGTLILNGANTWGAVGNGGFTMNTDGGKVVLGNESALGYGTFTLRNSASWDSSMSGSHTMINNNRMTFYDLNGSYTFVGSNSLNMGNGDVYFTGSSGDGTCTLAVDANTLTLGGNVGLKNDYTEGNTFGYGLKKTGAGTLVLNGATDSSTRGTISLEQGGLSVGNAGVFGRSGFVWKADTTLDATANVTLNMFTGRQFNMYGGGTHTFAGTHDLNTGNVEVAAYSGDTNLVVNGGTLTFGGDVVLGSYALTKQGAGALTLLGATTSSTSKEITLDGGRLNVGNAAVFGSSNFVWKGGTTLDATTNLTLSMLSGRAVKLYGGGDFTFAGSHNLNIGPTEVGVYAGDAHVAVNNGSTLTFGGEVYGSSYNLYKSGDGTLVIGGGATNNGLISDKGTLVLGAGGNLKGETIVNSGNTEVWVTDNGGAYDATYKVAFDGTKSVSNHDVRSQLSAYPGTGIVSLRAQVFSPDTPTGDITMQWRERSAPDIAALAASNVLNLAGSAVPSKYLLAMSYDPSQLAGDEATLASAGLISIAYKSGGAWVNTGTSFQGDNSLPTTAAGFDTLAALPVGSYGVDSAYEIAWVVLDHASEFTIISVPEPGSVILSVTGLIGLLVYGWRRRK